ncbi:EamA family transporter [Pyxidicoccus parkwayensis]|uniref:EamA family transporter n=2 Tax=Pyxidicoccus parkwayensis TaxID=2813578 RepID=A0ABX7P190_9BACT|nr:DMT family transporter [Pyxidicoccus parkwaysis]QSQ23590.1 EamA family transporter [Pyxidicoccus parkwaysis]
MGAQPARPLTSTAASTSLAPVYAAMCVQVLISAGTYLAGKRAMTELPPLTVVMWRFILSGAVFVLLLGVTPGPKLPPRHEWKRVLGLGLLAGPVNQAFFFYGLSKSSAAHAALFYSLTPMGVYLLSLARGQERVSVRAVGGIVTAFAGVVVLLLGRGLADASGSLLGDVLILGAVVAWVLYTTEGKPFVAEHGTIRATAWSMTAATLMMLLMAPFMARPAEVLAASAVAKGSIVYLGLLTSVVAYLIWYYALSKVPASKVAIFSNLQPPATAIAAWLLLGEALHWELAVGGVLVLAGVRLTQTAHVKPPPSAPLPPEGERQAA